MTLEVRIPELSTGFITTTRHGFFSENDGSFYLTLTINLHDNTVELFNLTKSVGKNVCNEEYLDKDAICNENIPFTVGMMVDGNPLTINCSSFKLYGCRLYDRVLSNEEIKLNYENSKSLLNDEN